MKGGWDIKATIDCYLITKGKLKAVEIPESLLSELAQSLRTKGIETVHFADSSIECEGIYIPAKGTENMVVVFNKEEL